MTKGAQKMEPKQPDSFDKWLTRMVSMTDPNAQMKSPPPGCGNAATHLFSQEQNKQNYGCHLAFKTSLEVYRVFKDTWIDQDKDDFY